MKYPWIMYEITSLGYLKQIQVFSHVPFLGGLSGKFG